MPFAARAYIAFIGGLGLVCLAAGAVNWQCDDWVRFGFYTILSSLCSGLKVTLPGIRGTMSISYVLILLGAMQLSLGETVALGVVSALVQSFWQAREKADAVRLVFNISSIAVASTGAWCGYHALEATLGTHSMMRLGMAASIYFLLNTVSISMVVGLTERRRTLTVWRTCYFWSFPYYLIGATFAMVMNAMGNAWGWEVSALVLPGIYVVHNSYRMYLNQLHNEKKHAEEVAGLHLRTIEALALAIEAKDDTTHDHLRRVQIYCGELGKDLGLDEQAMKALQAASILHDIGKLAVPDYIISKPGKLSPEEFEKMKIHPVVGAEILARVKFPYAVVPVVRAHHEKWDGSGYPDGLTGEEIPIGARILSAVDCLDALASDRQYRRALPLEEALAVVVAESGKSFDPKVVEVLRRRGAELEKKARAETPLEAPVKLSKDVKVERGQEPATGFENDRGSGEPHSDPSVPDFLALIAAARQEVQGLFEVTQDLGNSLSLHETLSVLCLRLKQLIPHDCLAIYIRSGDLLRPAFVQGENARLFSSLEIPMGQGLSGWVAENGKPIVNGNPSVEPGYLNDPTKFSTLRSALSVPLSGVGEVTGAVTLYRADRDSFSRDQLRILLAINPKLAMAIDNALKYQQAQQTATTDGLTGLLNTRSLFLHLDRELARCRRTGISLSVVVCDLDGFKQVNDRHGHLQGNRVLKLFALQMRELCREYDGVARMGGDEFVMILPDLPHDAVEAKIEKLVEAIRRVGDQVCREPLLGLSAGHASFPADGVDAEELLAAADARMYRVKHSHQAAAGK